MTQVYTGTITTLGWTLDTATGAFCLRGLGIDGNPIVLSAEQAATNFLALGHIDHLPPHQQRVIAEHAVNKDRLVKLKAFIDGDVFDTLPAAERNDLYEQGQIMQDLVTVLERRIDRFTQVAQASA